MNAEMEIWRPVVSRGGAFLGLYEVSSLGRVRSLTRCVSHGHTRTSTRKGKLLAANPDADGYLKIRLGLRGQRWSTRVQILVTEAFHGPRPPGHVCRHLNGNHQDNRADNLAWGTAQDNADDRERMGRTSRGPEHSRKQRETMAAPHRRKHAGMRRLVQFGTEA